jgi:hypothetical protein
MSRSLSGYIFLLGVLLLSSCAKVVYTHQQLMQSFHTKADVLKHLGNPDRVKEGNDVEEWIYTRPVAYIHGRAKNQDMAHATMPHPDTLKFVTNGPNSQFIRFIFDPQGNVVGYKSQDENLGHVYKESFGITALKVLGIAALVIIVVGLDINSNSDFNF